MEGVMEEEESHLGHTRRERKDEFLVLFFSEQWHDYFDNNMCFKAKV